MPFLYKRDKNEIVKIAKEKNDGIFMIGHTYDR